MEELEIIGKNIVRLRKHKKMTQDDLAGDAGIDRSYLSEVENGKKNVGVEFLVDIAHALGCSLVDLVTSVGPEADATSRKDRRPKIDAEGNPILKNLNADELQNLLKSLK